MINTHRTILSSSATLLLCFTALALAAPPDGKGGGKGGKGDKSVDVAACFVNGDILSSNLRGELTDNGDFDILVGTIGSIDIGETITVGGDAGTALVLLESPYSILPAGTKAYVDYDPDCTANCIVTFDEASGVIWKIRLDRDKEPPNRVQLKMRWLNGAGLERHLRIGWVVQAYEDEDEDVIEKYPLDPKDYGTSTSSSLHNTTVTFASDLFRIDGDVVVLGSKGKKMKTELEVFSLYDAKYPATPWCGGGTDGSTCQESTTIRTLTGTDCV